MTKNKELVIFGADKLAEVAEVHFTDDSEYTITAYAVHGRYLEGRSEFHGKPLVAFEDLPDRYPNTSFELFVAVGRNRIRRDIYNQCKDLGYGMASCVDSTTRIRTGTTVGENTLVLGLNNIDPFTTIGNNTIIWGQNHLGHHGRIGNHVFIASGVTISGSCDIGDGAYLASGVTVSDGVKIAPWSFVGMSASITQNTESEKVYLGQRSEAHDRITIDHPVIRKYL